MCNQSLYFEILIKVFSLGLINYQLLFRKEWYTGSEEVTPVRPVAPKIRCIQLYLTLIRNLPITIKNCAQGVHSRSSTVRGRGEGV